MIKVEDKYTHISLDSILSEIMALSVSIGACKSSIEHTEDLLYRIHGDIKTTIDKMDNKLSILERAENQRQNRRQFMWRLLAISPVNIIKWISIGIIIVSILTGIFRIGLNQKLLQLMQFAMR